MTKIEIFIAHDSRDSGLAHQVKWALEELGASTFIAPPDIGPSEDWRKEIFAHLTTCTALVAVVTENFSQSPYSNQEAGIVLGKEKPVIPIRIDEARIPGFIEARQAIPATGQTIAEAAKKAFNFVKSRDLAFIRTGFVPHSTVKDIVIREIMERILWTGRGTNKVNLLDRNIVITSLTLDEKTKTYSASGDAEFGDGAYNVTWAWSIVVDAISGSIMGSHTKQTRRY